MKTIKHTAIAGIAALVAGFAAPSFAQDYYYGYQHSMPHYGYYPNTAEYGECFVETDKTLGFGYWGSCATQGRAVGRGSGSLQTQNLPYGR